MSKTKPLGRECPYKDCKHDHLKYDWLDEIIFSKLSLDLTTKDMQYPIIIYKDLHEARAEIITKLNQAIKAFAEDVEKRIIGLMEPEDYEFNDVFKDSTKVARNEFRKDQLINLTNLTKEYVGEE